MSRVLLLLQKDLRSILRDRFLVWISLYLPLLALGLRFGVEWLPVPDLPLYVAPWMAIVGGSLLGTLFGFGLIEEREQGTWLLLRTLPVPPAFVSAYLAAVATAFGVAYGLVCVVLYGHPVADVPFFLAMLVASGLTAPVVMWLLGALARNKVEGLAVSKSISTASFVPLLGFALPAAWHWTLMWCPYYWLYVGLLRAYAGADEAAGLALPIPELPAWLFVLLPSVLSVGAIAGLTRIYRVRAV